MCVCGGAGGGVQGHVKAVLLIFQLTTADPEAPVHTDKVTVQLSAGKT